MLVFFATLILILQFLVYPFVIGIKGHIDFYNNDSFFSVYIFGVPIFKAHAFFQRKDENHNNIVIKHGKKLDEIHINNDMEDKKSIVKIIKNPALENILIKKVETDFIIGKKNNAFTTTLLLTSIKIATYAVTSFLKCRYKVETAQTFEAKYNGDFLEADFLSIISISLADIIISSLVSYFKKPLIKVAKSVKNN